MYPIGFRIANPTKAYFIWLATKGHVNSAVAYFPFWGVIHT